MTEAGRTYAGVAPDERRAARRRRLLDSALELFGTQGYVDVPIQALCSHAGVTARHLYEVFGSREAVLVDLHTELIDEGARVVVDAVASVPSDDPYAMSEVGVSAFLHYMLGDRRRAQIICFEVMALPQKHMQGCMQRYAGILEAYAQGLSDAGLLGTQRVHLTSMLLAGGVRQLMADSLLATEPAPIEDLIAETVRAFALVGDFLVDGLPPELRDGGRARPVHSGR